MTQQPSSRNQEQQGPVVLVDKHEDGKIYVITMNRPHRMNALGGGMGEALYNAWAEFRDDPRARVAILTGAGDRAFCAGADLIETSERRQAEARGETLPRPTSPPRSSVPLSEGMNLWKPTIAAINGYAVAGGFMMAMQCDIRIAAEHAEIGIAEVRWNMGAGWLHTLTRQMHLQHALELVLWGDQRITAQRAYEMGWVNRVVPKERLMDEAMKWAERMLYLAPRAVRNLKEIITRGFYMSPMEGAAFARAVEQNLSGMKDSIEGPTAFAEKRRPNFQDS
ncbi:MAG: enoyl-CoA hydratase/isomerase family protein [Chloroflexi bacterium]|nr:enoyl-CoA hydratase/isomerase family protein [Chloroflexota bacterium]